MLHLVSAALGTDVKRRDIYHDGLTTRTAKKATGVYREGGW